jgi:hypothetical protein
VQSSRCNRRRTGRPADSRHLVGQHARCEKRLARLDGGNIGLLVPSPYA